MTQSVQVGSVVLEVALQSLRVHQLILNLFQSGLTDSFAGDFAHYILQKPGGKDKPMISLEYTVLGKSMKSVLNP